MSIVSRIERLEALLRSSAVEPDGLPTMSNYQRIVALANIVCRYFSRDVILSSTVEQFAEANDLGPVSSIFDRAWELAMQRAGSDELWGRMILA